MIRRTLIILSLLFAFVLLPAAGYGQTRRPNPPAAPLKFLPASDVIVLIDAGRLINEALPQATAGDAEKLARLNAEIAKFTTRTGIDPHSFDRVVLGMRYTYPSADRIKIETVAIAHGAFDAKAITAASRAAAKEDYREEKYRGMTISILRLHDQLKLAGVWDVKINELAVCVLDANTLAMGSVANVRAAIAAGRVGAQSNAALSGLASRDPRALVGFGANVTRALLDNLHVGTDAVAKDAGSIRQVYGSIGSTPTDFSLLLVARTGTAAEAKGLSETVTGLQQLGAIFVVRLKPPTKALAQSGLDNLKITTVGNEVQIRTRIAASDLAPLIK